MKAAIFNPYLDTLGGGERYTMAIAAILAKKNYIVDCQWKDSLIKDKLEKRFAIDLKNINFIPDVKRGDGYDVCFWVSDGSIPTLRSRKNFLHFQVPFTHVGGNSLINRFKLMRINKVIVNSNFTKEFIDKEFGIDSFVLHPPVGVDKFKPGKKENTILSVARFSSLMQSKRQDLLVDVFKNFYKSDERCKLILAGGIETGADEFIKKLEKEIKGYPIEIFKSPDFKTLKNLYAHAKIFVSAAGYKIDEAREPQKVEHFGIAVVESMAAGCVPIVYNAGGHKEIIENNINGFLWNDTGELYGCINKILSNEKLRKEISKKAISDAHKFSYEKFEEKFISLL